MAIHGSQCRALMLETISHAQRVTSAAPHPTYQSWIFNGAERFKEVREIQVLVQLDQAERLH